MKIVFLDGEKIGNIAEVHEIFAKELGFPDYYGKNLDALHDCLTDMHEKIGVIVVNLPQFEKALGRRARSFFTLLEDLTDELDEFYLLIDPFEEEKTE